MPVIKNFDEVKKQLGELSDVVNKFKSEQVQLKIVELVFRGAAVNPENPEAGFNPAPLPRKRARRGKGEGTPLGRKQPTERSERPRALVQCRRLNSSSAKASSTRNEPSARLLITARPKRGILRMTNYPAH
jgi:hypothetical protein